MSEKRFPDWQRHEAEVQERLGLGATVGSGSKFYDISDGTDRDHPTDGLFQLMVDCKATVNKSYSLVNKFLRDWRKTALEWDKVFLLPLRFENEDGTSDDWVVMHLDDAGELLDKVRNPPKVKVEEKKRTSEVEDHIEALTDLVKSSNSPDDRIKLIEAIEFLEREYRED